MSIIFHDLQHARDLQISLQRQAQAVGVQLRQPPPEPTSCCGRGCNGCVWEGYYAAMTFWHEDAVTQLTQLTTSPP